MPDREAFSLSVREAYADNMLCALGKGDSEWLYGQFRNSMKNDELKAKVSDVFNLSAEAPQVIHQCIINLPQRG